MHIVIIGNGISGTTAARHIRKLSHHRITVISSESKHFFARTALMYLFMRQMTLKDITPYEPWFWKKSRIDLLMRHVSQIDHPNREIVLSNGQCISYDQLIIASGSRSSIPDIPGTDLDGVQGFYSMQDLESLEKHARSCKHAVIAGGGLIGIEVAEMLASRGIQVHMVVREEGYYGNVLPAEESRMINNEIRRHGINLHLNTTIESISGQDRVSEIRTSHGKEIPCDLVVIATGVKPNIEFLAGSGIETSSGVLVDDQLRTNIPGIFAAGDCAELRTPQPWRRSIEPAWYTGRMMGEVAAYNTCGFQVPYEPGLWFNSAKFLDIEFQVYGDIRPHGTEGISSFYWENTSGRKSLRINFNSNDKAVTGFSSLGHRLRQEVCEKWIHDRATIEEVMTHLGLANFDPEFCREYQSEMIRKFNTEFKSSVSPKQFRSASAAAKFLRR